MSLVSRQCAVPLGTSETMEDRKETVEQLLSNENPASTDFKQATRALL